MCVFALTGKRNVAPSTEWPPEYGLRLASAKSVTIGVWSDAGPGFAAFPLQDSPAGVVSASTGQRGMGQTVAVFWRHHERIARIWRSRLAGALRVGA